MTALLASVRSLEEAAVAAEGRADVIDLKDPSHGALAALPEGVIRDVVAAFGGRVKLSATAGDLAMEPAAVVARVSAMAALGVDFVKIGLRPEGDPAATVAALGRLGLPLVAVLFADLAPDLVASAALAAAGFRGVMLDTADKSGGGLTTHLGAPDLARFVARAHAAGLFTGLAGSLRLADVATLLPLGPDYLGFRGALAVEGRAGTLDPARLAALRAAIPRLPAPAGLAAGQGLSIMSPG